MKLMMKQRLSTYVKADEIDNLKRQTEFEYNKRKTVASTNGNAGGDSYGGY